MIDVGKLFHESIKDSIGCTEPAAIALAVSTAFNAINERLPVDYLNKKLDLPPKKIGEEIENITVKTDKQVFKNALHAGISYKYGLKGINSAAALGVFCDPGKNLGLFDGLSEEKASETANLLNEGKVDVTPDYEWDELRIEARVRTKDRTGVAYIVKDHSNITYIEVDGKPKLEKPETQDEADRLRSLQRLSDFVKIIEEDLPRQVNGKRAERRIEDAIKTNHKASLIAERNFLELGRKSLSLPIKNFVSEGYAGTDYINLAKEKVSLATEGRMVGFDIRVMTCAGSGNMGLVATLPLIAIALSEFRKKCPASDVKWDSIIEAMEERTPEDWEKLIRATALVHLIANYVTIYSGRLSALCGGGIKAGIGVAAGIAYYLTAPNDKNKVGIIGQAINNMAGGVVGMICDGAKRGCALKLRAATGAAIESALLACQGLGLSYGDGIVNEDAMVTLQHIGGISKAMESVDRKIIEFLQDLPPKTKCG